MFSEQKGIPLASSQIKLAAKLMARAFIDDPFFIFVIPNTSRRSRSLPWIFEKNIRYGHHYGKVYTTASLEGIALWLGPDKPGLEWLGIMLTGMFLLPFQLGLGELERSLRLARSADGLHKQSVTGRHWYLLGLGVEPASQGMGVAGTLLQPILLQADRDGLPCYLDTNNEKNLAFYERYGFSVEGRAHASQNAPPTWGMLRKPGLKNEYENAY